VRQARGARSHLEERDNGPLVVIDVVVPEQELVRRLAGVASARTAERRRRQGTWWRIARAAACDGAADDDNQDVVLERLKVYQHTTGRSRVLPQPVTFRVVNGAQAPDAWRTSSTR
jgi:adenylate kinase family enzyme